MKFADKLTFLMGLTNTSNKQLAKKTILDPSQISRLRSGIRKPPRNAEYISAMADYFSDVCKDEYKLVALAEKIDDLFPLQSVTSTELRDKLANWLTVEDSKPPEVKESKPRFNSVGTFWGATGTSQAMDTLLTMVLDKNQPTLIQMYSDEESTLQEEEVYFYRSLPKRLKELSDMGCQFQRISRPNFEEDYIFSSIMLWLSVYMEGVVESYIYPHPLESAYHHTIIVAHGVGAVVSTSVGKKTEDGLCYLFTDEAVVDYYIKEFNDYLSICKTSEIIYKNEEAIDQLVDVMKSNEKYNGNLIQKNYGLSPISMPVSLYDDFIKERVSDTYENMQPFLEQRDEYFKGLGDKNLIDIINISPIEKIRLGKAPLSITHYPNTEAKYYTKEEYREHLLGTIVLLKRHDNYKVIIGETKRTESNMLLVYGSEKVILTKKKRDLSLIEMNDPELVISFQKYVRQKYNIDSYTDTNKRHTIFYLETLASKIKD